MTSPTSDPLYRLTVAELDAASRLLKTDIVTAIATDSMHRWAGMAIVAFLLAKRDDPSATLTTFRNMDLVEITSALGLDDPAQSEEAEGDDDNGDVNAGDLAPLAGAEAALAQDPTAPSPA